ncbi:hypothetical protein [Methylobacterium radiodurans]|uniref:Uncharacterized protein n=1 Tax=Methylobacterium radiodurans TaxID=2202828 RepID=A0A2U8VVM8_9HYPH|nr:hypothetical protein [Methylobacterium radiodurans]AWN37176.1 hypothetical protein DK427_16745 [Methylobacterium radiodurans]
MNAEIRAILLAATLLAGPGGAAGAAERTDGGPKPAQAGGTAASGESVGAGGLTGSGATRDGGARRTDDKPAAERGGSSAAPAAGTAR